MKNSYLLFGFLFLILTVTGCKKNKKESRTNIWDFRDYVTSYSQGMISKADPIQIQLRNDVTGYPADTILPNNIISVSPNVKGETHLEGNNKLIFIPNQNLNSNQIYDVRVDFSKLYKDAPKKKKFFFQIHTLPLNFNVDVDEFATSEKGDGSLIIIGQIVSSDFMNAKDAQKVLKASQDNQSLNVIFSDDTNEAKTFSFNVEGIQKKNEESTVELTWNGKAIQNNNKGSLEYTIPPEGVMSVIQVQPDNGENQMVRINFSDELDKNQDFNGIIQIDTLSSELKFIPEGNVLSVFTPDDLVGEYEVTVHDGVKSVTNNTSEPYIEYVNFSGKKPALKLIDQGVILPNSKQVQFNFEAVGLQAVDVRIIKIYQQNVLNFLQMSTIDGGSNMRLVGRPVVQKTMLLNGFNTNKWQNYSLDLSDLIQKDLGSIYRIELSFKPEYSTYNCGTPAKQLTTQDLMNQEFSEIDEDFWDGNSYYDNYWDWEEYNWRERDNPCHNAYYGEDRSIASNLLASNIGLIAKQGTSNNVTVFATNIVTAKPESGVVINYYNYQRKLLQSNRTNKKGEATYQGKERISFIEAAHKGQTSYLSLEDGNSLNVSQFPVDGYRTQDGLKGYIYGERGIWRPGDQMHFSFIVNDNENPIPDNHPVIFTLTDPKGVVVDEQVAKEGLNGFYTFETATNEESPTGKYIANVRIGNANFTQAVPVENIKPNRLKIEWDSEGNRAEIKTRWLHGATASNLKTTVDATVRKTDTKFKNFPNFEFDNPAQDFETEEIRVYSGETNSQGEASFSLNFADTLKAPGKLRATYITKVYERGGNFSIDAFSEDLSPYSSYVGLLTPTADNYYHQLDTDVAQNYQVVTVTEDGKPKSVSNLEVKIYKVDFQWWWYNSEDDASSFASGLSSDPVFSKTISTNSSGKANFDFQVRYPDWGRYLIQVYNPQSGHTTGSTVYYDWPSWRGRSNKSNQSAANVIPFSTDKEEYTVGEQIEINFPSNGQGRALVSVETGSSVIDAFWVETKEEYTQVKIKATDQMAPNVYLNLTYLQPHEQSANDLPIRMYGIAAIDVYDKETKLEPEIIMTDVLRPEEDFSVTVKEKNGKAMTYTLAVVDEGLLDLTRFETPQIWDAFFQKQALGVHTWDLFDYVIGAYTGRIDQVLSIGGGDMAKAAGATRAQRFKPVVEFLGPFQVKGGKQTHKLTMPNYVGSVRVMVIAGDVKRNAFGSTDKAVPVKTPLMILGTMPRKISPTETIKLPVSVFAMENNVKNVQVKIETNDLIEVIGPTTNQVQFNEPGEQDTYFTLKAKDNKGIGNVKVIATGAGKTSSFDVEVDLFNPNVLETSITEAELFPNITQTIVFTQRPMDNKLPTQVQISSLPYINFADRLDYLIQYPHGCAEQITSAGFPQLYIGEVADISEQDQYRAKDHVEKAIYRLKNLQNQDGGFRYWPSSPESEDYLSSYIGHFLLEAKDKAFKIPNNSIENWISFQKQKARSTTVENSPSNQFNQAYRLYTLALAGEPDLASMNRLREISGLSTNTKLRLAAAYALAGQATTANSLIDINRNDFLSENNQNSYGSTLRNKAMALETYTIVGNSTASKLLVEDIGQNLSSGQWFSTQAVGYSLYALSRYLQKNGGPGANVTLLYDGQSKTVQTDKPFSILEIPSNLNQVQVMNNQNQNVFVRTIQRGVPSIGYEQPESRGLLFDVKYIDMEGKEIAVSNLPQTTEFISQLTVKNNTGSRVDNVALTQQIPSGWEIINTRYTEAGDKKNSDASYIDIRDARVNYYFDLPPGKEVNFQMLLNASFVGKYYLPGSIAEAMYDKDNYYAKKSGQWIEVSE